MSRGPTSAAGPRRLAQPLAMGVAHRQLPDPMQHLPAHARVALYEHPGAAFVLRDFPLRAVAAGEVLVRVRMCTICRSDIHSWLGHRPNPAPGLLGHEIVGTIVALGADPPRDLRDATLQVGDRITWTEYVVPPGGSHAADVLDLPQKSPGVEKYGHRAATEPPHHHGGFAQYCYVVPRTWILRVPDELSDEEAAPLNCGVATALCIVENTGVRPGQDVVVFGLGLLGLVCAAAARARGARRIIGIDRVANRRELARRFGCDDVIDPSDLDDDALVRAVAAATGRAGVDAVIEVCGDPDVLPAAIALLRVGGCCVTAGVVNPDAFVRIDLHPLVRKLLTLRGVHNYHPRHLVEAVDFVLAQRARFPFASLIEGRYALEDVDRAMRDAAAHRVLRAAIVP